MSEIVTVDRPTPRLYTRRDLARMASLGIVGTALAGRTSGVCRGLLGVRGASMVKSGGGTPTARDYVQDGLVAMWDGIENAGFSTHDESSKIWKDLAGTRDATLTQYGRFESNYFEELGTGCAAYFEPDNRSIEKITIELVGSDFGGGSRLFDLSDGGANKKLVWYSGASTNSLRFSWANGGLRTNNQIPILAGTHTYSATLSANTSNTVLYHAWRDGLCQDGSMTSGYWGEWPSGGGFGDVAPNSSQVKYKSASIGKIMSLRYYDRHLTDDEIAANYAVDKARFGLA